MSVNPPLTLSHKRSQPQQRIHYTIPISRYVNRLTQKKVQKGQILVTSERLIIKQQKPQTKQWIQADSLFIYDIDNVVDKEKTQEEYTLLKIQLKTVPQNEKQNKSITFRILSIPLGGEVTVFINRTMVQIQNSIKNLPNYTTIQNKQTIIMRSIILSEKVYQQVFNKSSQMKLFNPTKPIEVLQFQRILLADHQKMMQFNKFKHTLKYQQQKNILIEKLKNKQNKQHNNARLNHHTSINLLESTNIDRNEIVEDLNRINKQGKEWLQGYSSKREFEGVNFTGGDDQLYSGRDIYGLKQDGELQIRNENLILKNITLTQHNDNQNFFDHANDLTIDKNNNKSKAILQNVNNNMQKMEIEQGQINDNNDKGTLYCRRMKIPDSRDVRLQQKVQDRKIERKSEIKFIDPSYSQDKERELTKLTIIWCRLFYHLIKFGETNGIEKTQKELEAIECELTRLHRADNAVKMNSLVSKMVQKAKANFIQMKRRQRGGAY